MNRLREKYLKEIAPKLVKELALSNVMQVPSISKISVNAGIGSFRDNKEAVASFESEFTSFAGQKPRARKARVSVAGFKVRKGETVGYSVTLRGDKMWAFLDKLVSVSLPRVRDFRGLSEEAFDADGNYSLGIREHVIFPEVNPNTTKGIRSLQVTLCLGTRIKEHNKKLLELLGIPFRKD
ncbi:50S ribosomal protein L5 [candidate division WWE3 bacterium RIFOXYC1_FULL_40_10]|uniref:Large ribosomal subunit protein uL5 n=1 Tax=candidate division WWE3 bacterium RIFOXYA2_FULL_46_9 TaxID=1802636 RepID=A0A1F4VZJ2_UNCKA|nr:MAG: 50S ribosomal protein L5 [candidate division WWE3 bacterium RIFOXYB1_FULL_40_22]OGC61857.1 MAG: 50S ribosomal protein L5 [candidate division WWE3 bacterium RIFOXYA1_FULL_40_11]OGC62223.1 MAG: 50S ribosomal protein L5 [candidate division WWE3 bacterium RIFOXYA2_FULL_46_9]OGC64329.1 MAG: 50S ribosomal protein L5 [candidate division WWE3 bacterium RIFOXYB2_FULL_41_6]OGC66240.1 MAG: 50S ribosomal protein L5 [candidate division WWE3 bacterium RIFOXYC1_FULL_40_10]OGC67846.1 MAG: 50S ribosoma